METLKQLHSKGQSLWVDHIAREQIYDGSLMQYISEGAITGLSLTSQAVCCAIDSTSVYEEGICKKLKMGLYGELLAIDLILEDLHHAADLLGHVFDRTNGVDGWAVLPVSPLLTNDPSALLKSASDLSIQLKRKNTLITIPGLPDMLGTVEELVFAGIPINISLIYSSDQCLNAATAYLRGIERRIDAGLKPAVSAFISIPIFHFAAALAKEMEQQTAIEVSIDIARNIYSTMRTLHASQQWECTYNAGARPLRLIWACPEDGCTAVADISLHEQLVAPFTVTAMSQQTLGHFISHANPEAFIPVSKDDNEDILARHQREGLNLEYLASSLQNEASAKQVKTWIALLDAVARKSATLMEKNPFQIGEMIRV